MKTKRINEPVLSKTDTVAGGNYRIAIQQAILDCGVELKPGDLIDTQILHDDWCPLLAGAGACCCYPVLVFRRFGLDGKQIGKTIRVTTTF